MKFIRKLLKNKRITCLLGILLIGTAGAFLTGCTKRTPVTPKLMVLKLTPTEIRQADITALRKCGVQVIKLGQTVRFVIHSDRLFQTGSANLCMDYQHVLNRVTSVLNTYHIVMVKVAAYSDNGGTRAHRNTVTDRQAQVVQRYLSDRGISARLIYGVGRGANNPVAWNGVPGGRASNRRVEISFKFYRKQD